MTALSISTVVTSGRGALVNVRQRSLLTARQRVLWVVAGFFALAFVALVRIAFLGVVESNPADENLSAALTPARADIVDRNGVPLARAFPAYSLWYNPAALGGDGPPLVHSARQIAGQLVQIFPDMNVEELTRRLVEGRPGYLRRRILPEDANRIHLLGEPALEFPRETSDSIPRDRWRRTCLALSARTGAAMSGWSRCSIPA